jgi:hypothetical protein
MTKVFCDRCGAEIKTDETGGWPIGLIKRRSLQATICMFPHKESTEWIDQRDKVICPACEDSFVEWFSNPE